MSASKPNELPAASSAALDIGGGDKAAEVGDRGDVEAERRGVEERVEKGLRTRGVIAGRPPIASIHVEDIEYAYPVPALDRDVARFLARPFRVLALRDRQHGPRGEDGNRSCSPTRRRRQRGTLVMNGRSNAGAPSVAVAVPAFNEAEGIGEFLREIDRWGRMSDRCA
jgi:hypothetical protein